MVFSDENLKRLKVHLETDKEFHENATWVEHVQMDALIARLEAAEKACSTPSACNCSQECDWHSEALCEWRKVSGK